MQEFVVFVREHIVFTIAASVINIILIRRFIIRISIALNRLNTDAMGGRTDKKSLYYLSKQYIFSYLEHNNDGKNKVTYYTKAKIKVKKSGFSGQYAGMFYVIAKYVVSVSIFTFALLSNFPNILIPFVATVLYLIALEQYLYFNRKNLNLKFQRYIYKIYKYLHNQISSGVKTADAIKTVYQIIDDKELKSIMIKLAASFELTKNIDVAISEFKSNFDLQEAETLSIALKQGIDTGDNQELLSRQERFMFSKYFNYVQAETDSCKTKALVATIMFTAICVIMISVPMLMDMGDALTKIFMY